MTLLYILLAVLIEYSPKESSLEPPGILWFGHSSSYPISMWILSPPSEDLRPTPKHPTYLLGGWLGEWVGGWAHLPFDTLDHVRTIFFQFYGL